MLFVVTAFDRPGAGSLRTRHRPAHLDHIAALGSRVRFGGPLLGEDGKPCGSLIMLEADDLASARKTAESDPYLTTGIFASVEVFETRQVAPDPAKT